MDSKSNAGNVSVAAVVQNSSDKPAEQSSVTQKSSVENSSDKPAEESNGTQKSSPSNVTGLGSDSGSGSGSDKSSGSKSNEGGDVSGVTVVENSSDKPAEEFSGTHKGSLSNVTGLGSDSGSDMGSGSKSNEGGDVSGVTVTENSSGKPAEESNGTQKGSPPNVMGSGSGLVLCSKSNEGGSVTVTENSSGKPAEESDGTQKGSPLNVTGSGSGLGLGSKSNEGGGVTFVENSSGKPAEESNGNNQKRSLSSANNLGNSSAKNLGNSSAKNMGNLSAKNLGNMSAKNMMFRADMIDFKNLDFQFDKSMSKTMSRERNAIANANANNGNGNANANANANGNGNANSIANANAFEEWEIDLEKLDLKSTIDRGAFGTVYKGVYDGKEVAVKVLNWEGMAPTEAYAVRDSFEKEVAVWHKLDHPNITKFIGASMGASNLTFPTHSTSGELYKKLSSRTCCVVLEYLPGGHLKNYLVKNYRNKLGIKVVMQLVLDLARGLSYLHSKKIVHRDVKTENVLLDSHSRLKIADFGVARVEAQNPSDMTGETGTISYMAPEVIQNKPYTKKCDVYSFAICLWETYCCDMPYPNMSFVEISYGVVHLGLRPEVPRCCPPALASIMRKCWDGNPKKRPEMDEVVRLLEAIDTGKGGGMVRMFDDHASQSCFCFGRGS